ncbi:tRNA pseudouridine(38-40) synthase TruA [Aureispira]|nr:tRNA pseudouridine(38-40) synthase TruA [Aureispira sp.]
MTRFFFHIAYNGKKYHGWQRQPNVRSVQEVIETQLAEVLKMPAITIVGCGRTDAKVHASQFFFHTDLAFPIKDDLLYILNKRLPDDISVFDIIEMKGKPHARFDAIERVYDYFIHTFKDPFYKDVSSIYTDEKLNLQKMKDAVMLLPLYENYGAFCKQPDLHNTTICKISSAKLFSADNGQKLRFRIASNRFLRGQVRIIVQKLLDIGSGKFSIDEFEDCLRTQRRSKLIKPAHPEGLFLSKVSYPFLSLSQKGAFVSLANSWQEI